MTTPTNPLLRAAQPPLLPPDRNLAAPPEVAAPPPAPPPAPPASTEEPRLRFVDDAPAATLAEATRRAEMAREELATCRTEIESNRALVASAESLRTQRNVAIAAVVVLGALWWIGRSR